MIRKFEPEDVEPQDEEELLDFPAMPGASAPVSRLPADNHGPPKDRRSNGDTASKPLLPTSSVPGSCDSPHPPLAVPSPVTRSVTDYLSQLKGTLLGDAIVHEEIIEPRPARFAPHLDHLGPNVARVVQAAGVDRLWTHQEQALSYLQAGRNVVLATPTASGKTLVYNAAVLSSLLADPHPRVREAAEAVMDEARQADPVAVREFLFRRRTAGKRASRRP